jgi:uncharacterized membrane protein
MKKGVILGLFLVFLILPICYAVDYYADITIDVDEAGFVAISGETNHPDLLAANSEKYTSKEQSYWTLNITKDDVFSDYVYSVNLPSSASINYIKSSGTFRIEQDNGKIVVKGFGQNKPMSIVVQYSLVKKEMTLNYLNIVIAIVGFVLMGLLISFIVKNRAKKAKGKESKNELPEFKGLSARQKQIVRILFNEKKPLTQGQLMEKMKIPKASISRNLKTLELKGVIEKEKAGMSNIIRLKK